MNGPLVGCTVAVTREQPGELGRMLADAGADVVHVPLIEIVDAEPAALEVAWRIEPDWVIVTSAAGVDRVAAAIVDRPGLRVGAVGTATARRVVERCGREVDLVPDRQLAAELVREFLVHNPEPRRVLVAQADRAATTLVDGLVEAGHDVAAVVAYRTVLRRLDDAQLAAVSGADAVIFTSGSAARAWVESVGDRVRELPRIVLAIGPTTAAVAAEFGLKVTHVAADHSLAGVIAELIDAWGHRPAT